MKIDYKQLSFIDGDMIDILAHIESCGWEPTITSMYRVGDAGVHGTIPLRGIDIRVRGSLGRMIANEVIKSVNSVWIYDPDRPEFKCAIAHGSGHNFHIHLQTHPNTREVKQ